MWLQAIRAEKRGRGAHLEVVLVEVLDFGRLNELVEAGHEGLHLLGHARHEAPLDHQTARASTHDASVYALVHKYCTTAEKSTAQATVERTRCTRACSRS